MNYFDAVLDHPFCRKFALHFLYSSGPKEFGTWPDLKKYLKATGWSKILIKAARECWLDWKDLDEQFNKKRSRD